jgi:hypothetical protein
MRADSTEKEKEKERERERERENEAISRTCDWLVVERHAEIHRAI